MGHMGRARSLRRPDDLQHHPRGVLSLAGAVVVAERKRRTVKLIVTDKRWRAGQCSGQFCKKPRWIFVRIPEGNAGMCRKHYGEWVAQRHGKDGKT